MNRLHYYAPCGDTVFNKLPMRTFMTKWNKLSSQATGDVEKEIYLRVAAMAEQCAGKSHLYLKFLRRLRNLAIHTCRPQKIKAVVRKKKNPSTK